MKSLDSTLGENNYDSYSPPIPKKVLKSEIDTVTYQWIATTNSTGCVNAANVMVLKPDPQKQGRNKLTAFDILRQFFAKINIADILLYTSNKISNIRSDLPYENLQNDKYSYINIVAESKLLFFFSFMYARGLLGQTQLQTKNSSPMRSVNQYLEQQLVTYNNMLFIEVMLTFDDPETKQERWKMVRFAAFRSLFERFNKACAQTTRHQTQRCY